jgi:hypothetical protein
MQFYSGPPMHLLSGVHSAAGTAHVEVIIDDKRIDRERAVVRSDRWPTASRNAIGRTTNPASS